jgi:signal transduction histidine kinase
MSRSAPTIAESGGHRLGGVGRAGTAGTASARASVRNVDRAIAAAGVLVLAAAPAMVGESIRTDALVRALAALGALCLAALARRRAPSVAWLGAVAAAGSSATLWFDRARPLLATDTGGVPWVVMASVASIWAVGTAVLAGCFATRERTRLDPVAVPITVGLVSWLVVACVTTVGLVLAGQRQPDPAFTWVDVATVPIGIFLPILLVLVGLGIAADVRAGTERARARLGIDDQRGAGRRPSSWALAVATARELVPGQASIATEAQEAERLRLAGDLHATILPALRRAIDEAERGGEPARLAATLHQLDRELERLMADRWPVVLEAFGLLRAIEEIAERLEASGSPPISIAVDPPTGEDSISGGARAGIAEPATTGAEAARDREGDRPPAMVERAAWRFVEVVLDNAVRHARATAIDVAVLVRSDRVRIAVSDDGIGPSSARPATRAGRGLADAGRRAEEIGGSVAIAPGAPSGTVVRFEWSTNSGV